MGNRLIGKSADFESAVERHSWFESRFPSHKVRIMQPKEIGERTEAAILNHFIQKGIPVSIPWGNNQRYDLILDYNGTLLKAQCKTGVYKKGVVMFASSSHAGGKARKDYIGQVDCFLVYCEVLNKFYKVDLKNFSNINAISLRVDPLKKCAPKSKINWAKDYEI